MSAWSADPVFRPVSRQVNGGRSAYRQVRVFQKELCLFSDYEFIIHHIYDEISHFVGRNRVRFKKFL